MKKYLLILAAILFLWGCIAEDRTECTNPRGVFVSLTVRPERMSSVTRSADETAIRDLNLYLYDDNGNVVLHRYQTSATLRFECLPGDYRMCIAANLGRDLGENPTWEDFTVTHADKDAAGICTLCPVLGNTAPQKQDRSEYQQIFFHSRKNLKIGIENSPRP